jgi:transposase
VAFLTDIVVRQSKTREIHIVLDNLSAQKTRRVVDFLEAHPNVQLNFTPTYSSWLNQVELWFAKIERDLIYRGVFTSVTNLARRIMKYIRRYDKQPDRHPCRGVRHTSTQQLAPCGLSC